LMSGLVEVQNANVSSSYAQEFLICQEVDILVCWSYIIDP
jgi:hypothetical protein